MKRDDFLEEKNINELFEKYYNEHIDYIKQYCYYKLGDYPDYADDCVQDTFRVLFEKLLEDVEFQYIKAFLIKAASNFVKLKFREIDKEKNKSLSIDNNEIDIPYEQNFFDDVSEETILDLKDEIISSLTKGEQILLSKTCKKYENSYKTTKELAIEYSCSETNIRQKIFVLRTKIRKLAKEKTKDL